MPRASLVVFGLALVAHAPSAFAGACPEYHLTVIPGDDLSSRDDPSVPTNVELRVLFGAAKVEVIEIKDRTSRTTVATGSASADDATLLLRTAGGKPVPLTLRRALAAPHPVWLARPTAELAANTKYVVSVHTHDRDYVVAHFTTASGRDDDAPALARVASSRVYRWPAPTDFKDTSGSFAELALEGLHDATGLEVHELADGESASETTLRWAGSSSDRIRIGALTACEPPSFDLAPAVKTKRHVWVRAVDLAGNASPLREAVIDASHPKLAH